MFCRGRAREELPYSEEDQKLLMGMVEMWGCYVGDRVERQSLKFAWMEECCGGGNVSITAKAKTGCPELTRIRRIDRHKHLRRHP
jgi:hypothetical protein